MSVSVKVSVTLGFTALKPDTGVALGEQRQEAQVLRQPSQPCRELQVNWSYIMSLSQKSISTLAVFVWEVCNRNTHTHSREGTDLGQSSYVF